MRFVPLNVFQRLMRLWDQVHPYNAVHACRIQGPADIQRIADAWRLSLSALGVGRITVRDEQFRHVAPATNDRSADIQVHDSNITLDQLITDEMNTRMNPDEGCPFRAYVLQEADTHCVGITYHHWVADSVSIRRLMHEWFIHMQDPSRNGTQTAHIPSEGQWHYFGPDNARWRLDEGVLTLLRNRTRFTRARYIDQPVTDGRVEVTFHYLPDGTSPKLAALARKQKATFNDLMLAALAQVVDVHGVTPSMQGRDELAIGTIVDLRGTTTQKMDDVFGVFLGFTTTMLRNQDMRDWNRLLKRVARQNAFQKHSKAAQTSILRMAAALVEGKIISPQKWGERYRRQMPLAGGISNVNMNRTWVGEHHPNPILDYFRIAPTGPMLPFAITPTTLGNRLNIGICRLANLIDARKNDRIARAMANRLIELATNGR